MSGNRIVALGAALGGLAVTLGAFGAHGLKSMVTADQLAIFETAVRYHFYHALALVAVGLLGSRDAGSAATPAGSGVRVGLTSVAWCFLAGIAIFSGSLYLLVLTGARWLGAITPIGGISLIVGWALFARAALRANPTSDRASGW